MDLFFIQVAIFMLKQKKGAPQTAVMNPKRNGWKICLYAAARKVSLIRAEGQTMSDHEKLSSGKSTKQYHLPFDDSVPLIIIWHIF